ncbi:hypothetical protein PoB_002166100 [Plakobranchus ocellatus]|uniref:Uncharacterized protein n=1 Tax=Plakobranchus ocellatus TaxID=259542 RepID=A0AAV3ZKV3_9GAST|nr:hypothetical protein PoB_002166100 [Plakobranchus ocellatus]
MPRFFKETALLEDSDGGTRTWEPQTENATSHCGMLLLSSSLPLTPVPVAVESRTRLGYGYNLSLICPFHRRIVNSGFQFIAFTNRPSVSLMYKLDN